MFRLDKNKENSLWKQKALGRRKIIKDLNKRINELEKSRDTWKQKADNLKEINKSIYNELKKN